MSRRFIILLHEKPGDVHWDLMLESGDALVTWAIPPPVRSGKQAVSFQCRAVRLPDHRLFYLDYEGPVSNDRGSVSRVDTGTFEPSAPGRFRLRGTFFDGTLSVDPPDEIAGKDDNVTLTFERTR